MARYAALSVFEPLEEAQTEIYSKDILMSCSSMHFYFESGGIYCNVNLLMHRILHLMALKSFQ